MMITPSYVGEQSSGTTFGTTSSRLTLPTVIRARLTRGDRGVADFSQLLSRVRIVEAGVDRRHEVDDRIAEGGG